MVCLNHPDTEAVACCGACGRPLCAACVYKSDGKAYCSPECAKKAKAAEERASSVISNTSAVEQKKKRRR